MGAFSKLFSRLRITSDPNVGTQTSAVIQADSTDSSLVLAPNGTGAIIASIPDGTATGGNARGQYAVDLKIGGRTASTQVASGNYSAVLGGNVATASGNFSIASGSAFAVGTNSVALGGSSFANGSGSVAIGGEQGGGLGATAGGRASIAFGMGNQATADWSNSLGGFNNVASSQYSTISGGQSNTASTGTNATVVGGQSNTSSGNNSLSSGYNNISSSQYSVTLNNSNTSTAQSSIAINQLNVAQSIEGFSHGVYSRAYLRGQRAHGSTFGFFPNTNGLSQCSDVIAGKVDNLTTAATTILVLAGGDLIIPFGNNRMWNVQIDTIAVVTTITGTATGVSVGDAYRETKQLLFKRVGGTSSIVGTVDTTAIKNDSSLATCALTVTAGASQEMALTFTAPTFTGGGSVTMRVVSKVMLVEVAY